MNANEYQRLAGSLDSMQPPVLDTEDAHIVCCVLGLTGEAGEVADKIKKHVRKGGRPLDFHRSADPKLALAMKKELGDVCWYIARMSRLLGWDLSAILAANVEKLTDRKERGVLHSEGDDR